MVFAYWFYSNNEENQLAISKLKQEKRILQSDLDRQALTIEQLSHDIESLKESRKKIIEAYSNSGQQPGSIGASSSTKEANPVASQIASSSLELESQLEQLSSSIEKKTQILKTLGKIGPFSQVDVADFQLDAYFDRINEIDQGNYYETHYLVNPDNYGSLNFDGSEFTPSEKKESFSDDSQRLYAHFNIDESYPHDSVLVKWYQQGGDSPLALDYYPINTNSSENYIWIEPGGNWQSGQYYVEVFSASEGAELLSAGSYQID